MATINKRLEKVEQQRTQNRHARQSHAVPSIALIGYTNAGKSTLFNRLTKSDVYVADQLFATLDPTSRRCYIPDFGNIVLIDTVGFIRHLPPDLIKAFKATLEETIQADLLLHVVDAQDMKRHEHKEEVMQIIHELGAAHLPLIQVYNKLDLVKDAVPAIQYDQQNHPYRVSLSSHSGKGLDLLYQALREKLI
jgi:GTP-binding protein HflX